MALSFTSAVLKSKLKYPLFITLKKYSSQAILKTELNASKEEAYKLSTLFVPGRRGSEMYQIVKPVIDINYISDNIENLKLSCDHRGIDLDFDLILKVAREWLNIKKDYLALVEEEQASSSELFRLNHNNAMQNFEVTNERRIKLIDKINDEKSKVFDIEDTVMPLLQKIPHILHSSTPLQFNAVDVCQKPPKYDVEIKPHTEIASNLLEFTNNPSNSYFLVGKLSELDFAIQLYFTDKMHNLGFIPLSGMDFCKSFIIEAIGYDPYSNIDCIRIQGKGSHEGQKLNLVGGASFESFCAYLTNMNLDQSTLPLKYFSLGRRYTAANNNNVNNLFSVVQSTNVHCIILSELSSKSEFDFLLESFLAFYSEFNIPYRTVNIAAKNLTIAESHRKQIELWSPALKDYIPVAYVSQHDDFISKRLQITYGIQHCKEGF